MNKESYNPNKIPLRGRLFWKLGLKSMSESNKSNKSNNITLEFYL